MRTWEFDLVTDRDMTAETDSDRLFELFGGDVTPGVIAGTPVLACSIEGPDLLAAVRDTMHRLTDAGVKVERVHLEPETVEA